MEPTYVEFQFAVPIYGIYGPSHAHAFVSVPKHTSKRSALPVIILLEGRANMYESGKSGRELFDDGVKDFILVTPKLGDDGDSAVLSRTNSQEDWRYAEDALWHLVTEGLFEIERRVDATCVDFSRIYCTGYSMGGDSCFGLAALPGVGRLLAGLVPFACKGDESMVYTGAGLAEFRRLRIWGLQNATERADWKMNWMVKTLYKLVDGQDKVDVTHDACKWEKIQFEAAWLEGEGTVLKYVCGDKEVWEIADSKSSTWTQRGMRYKHHNCWTDIMKYGVLDRYVTSWMLAGSNPHVDVAGEMSYSLALRRPVCRCLQADTMDAGAVPWEHAQTKRCRAQRLGVWASPQGVLGANIPWRDGCVPARGESTLVGDQISAWEERGQTVYLRLRRGRHLFWKPTDARPNFEGAICTRGSDADFHNWFVKYSEGRQVCFQERCLGNFEVCIEWHKATVVDYSRRKENVEAESTAAETEDEGCFANVNPRLQAEADKEKRAFLSSPFCTSMLCQSALDSLLLEYNCKLTEDMELFGKTDALREAVKSRMINQDFHNNPWRWVNRIRRALRDARQPWLQMSVLNDRLGLDRAGVPVTKKRVTTISEKDNNCDLFCFLDDMHWLTGAQRDGKKPQKELFVGLKSEVAKRYPGKYDMWVKPQKSQPGAARFCNICAQSEKRRHLATLHDEKFCKFAPKVERCLKA